jgi:preprotein translocase subunit SecA
MLTFDTIVAKFIGTRSDRELKKLQPLLQRVNELEATLTGLIQPAAA